MRSKATCADCKREGFTGEDIYWDKKRETWAHGNCHYRPQDAAEKAEEPATPGVSGEAQPPATIREDKLLAIAERCVFDCADAYTGDSIAKRIVQALRELAESLASPESPGPRCPKCGREVVIQCSLLKGGKAGEDIRNPYGLKVRCDDHGFDCYTLADFAQFFAAPSTPPADDSLRIQDILHNVKARIEAVEHVSFPARPHKCEYTDKERWDLVLGELRWIVRMFEQLKAATPQPESQDAEKLAGRIAEAVHLQFRPEDQIFYDSQKIKAAIIRAWKWHFRLVSKAAETAPASPPYPEGK